jgi:uncharacterized protein YutE (UPF0331/DUF86 family)
MSEKIKDKIGDIHLYLSKLIDILPESFDLYKSSDEKRWSCEHGFEKIAEAIADLSFLVVKDKKLLGAKDDFSVFDILEKNNIIEKNTAEKMQGIKKMRNIISHQYGEVDDSKVFDALSNYFERDVEEFISSIEKSIKEKK